MGTSPTVSLDGVNGEMFARRSTRAGNLNQLKLPVNSDFTELCRNFARGICLWQILRLVSFDFGDFLWEQHGGGYF